MLRSYAPKEIKELGQCNFTLHFKYKPYFVLTPAKQKKALCKTSTKTDQILNIKSRFSRRYNKVSRIAVCDFWLRARACSDVVCYNKTLLRPFAKGKEPSSTTSKHRRLAIFHVQYSFLVTRSLFTKILVSILFDKFVFNELPVTRHGT